MFSLTPPLPANITKGDLETRDVFNIDNTSKDIYSQDRNLRNK